MEYCHTCEKNVHFRAHARNHPKWNKGCDDKRYICSDSITTFPFILTRKCDKCDVWMDLGQNPHLYIETHVC